MKNLRILRLYLAVTFLFLLPSLLSAQEYYAAPNHGKGYWEIHTDYRTRNTVVDFFDADRKPLYQEILPKKYVKLTKKNIRQFDRLLDHFTSRNLVSSAVKSLELTADSRPGFSTSVPQVTSYGVQAINHSLAENIYVSDLGKLKIILKNPGQRQLGISLLDPQLKPVYQEYPGGLAAYNRLLNISRLGDGTYHLQITCGQTKRDYRLTINGDKFVNFYNLEALQ
jgi:hypothetical protein